MRNVKTIFAFIFTLTFSLGLNAKNEIKKTAETVFAFAQNMESFDEDILKAEMKQLSTIERVKLVKMSIADVKQAQLSGATSPSVGLYVLAVLLPPVAVGIHTNWGMPTVYNVLWTFLGYVPGVIHAFVVLGR